MQRFNNNKLQFSGHTTTLVIYHSMCFYVLSFLCVHNNIFTIENKNEVCYVVRYLSSKEFWVLIKKPNKSKKTALEEGDNNIRLKSKRRT